MCALYGLNIVYVSMQIALFTIIMQTYLNALTSWNICYIYSIIECLPKIKWIVSIIFVQYTRLRSFSLRIYLLSLLWEYEYFI